MSKPDVRQLIPVALQLINTFGVEDASVSLASGPGGVLRVRVEFRDVALRAGRFDGVHVDEGLIHIEGLDPAADPKAMVEGATIRIERLLIRVSASLVNRLLDSEFLQAEIRKKAPVEVRNLALTFADQRVIFRGELKKGLTFSFMVELFLEAVNNRLRIVFENFWAAEMVPMPGFLRKLVMSVVRSQVEGRRELQGLVSITDDYVLINPWPKVPLQLDAEFTRFGVEGHYFVVEMGPSASGRRPMAAPSAAAPTGPTPAPAPAPPAAVTRPVPPLPTPAPIPHAVPPAPAGVEPSGPGGA